MQKVKVANGIWWVSIPEAGLSVLCGCPADAVKHLIKRGLINTVSDGDGAYETGPNAILLSDVPSQGGELANLAEFPVLQMLYRQGLGIPGHPRNDGTRPLLIGIDDQVKAQSQYVMRGNYGLLSERELTESGTPEAIARTIMRMKLRFAFGRLRETRDILDLRIAGPEPVPLRGGATIRRRSFNVFEFACGAASLAVDLNLEAGERYDAPYRLPPRRIRLNYFSVVHIGEGDGWDTEKPCMGSLVIFQGKIYLVDAGPHILDSLTALGVGINEIEGIFQTHSHDDHFAGLTALVRSDHRIRYFAVPAVRASVSKKLSTLMGFNEKRFRDYFDVVDLAWDAWNDIDGLEVKPVLSAHPVETTVLFFRTLGSEGPSIYAHLADIPSFESLRSMVTASALEPGISRAFQERLEKELLAPVQLKKIDAGGGIIHGSSGDFKNDQSLRIVVSHVAGELSDDQKQIGARASFGEQDVLIDGAEDYALDGVSRQLRAYFPTSVHLVRMLVNCPQTRWTAGSLILRKGDPHTDIFIVVRGIVEFLDPEDGIRGSMGTGSLIGEYSALHDVAAIRTFRAVSDVMALRVPIVLYEEFLQRAGLAQEARRVLDNRQFLQDTWLLGEMISFPLLRQVAQHAQAASLVSGQAAALGPGLHVVRDGALQLVDGNQNVELLKRGAFFGEDLLLTRKERFTARARTRAVVLSIPAGSIENVPIIQWKLLETLERRIMTTAKRRPRGTRGGGARGSAA